MRELLPELLARCTAGEHAAVATVVDVRGSAPRRPGAAMLVGAAGDVVGSVSGGCVESAVYALAEQVLADGVPVVAGYGIADDTAFTAGLTCGGELEVLVERFGPADVGQLTALAAAVAAGQPVAVLTPLAGPGGVPGPRSVLLDGQVQGCDGDVLLAAASMLAAGRTGVAPGIANRVFVRSIVMPARLIVFGSTEHAAALATAGRALGRAVTVCDARATFTTRARFPDVDDLVVDWPHRYLAAELEAGRTDARTAVCVLTHDPRFDVPVLDLALRSPRIGWTGAMGSRRTHLDRLDRLRQAGLTEHDLQRLRSPIGLDLAAATPQEIAVSILAEIIADARGGSGTRLRRLGARPVPAAGS